MGSAAADYSRLFLCEETCWVNLIIVGQPYSFPALRGQYSVARTRRFTPPPCQSLAQSAGAACSDGGAPFLLHSAALRGATILLIAAAIPIGQRASSFIQKL